MTDVAQEKVLVVPTEEFHRLGVFQGFCPEADRYLDHLLQPQFVRFLPRSQVETDPSLKQLIPYVIFLYNEDGKDRVFCYTRGTGMGEGRLHRKRSVGIGGHISLDDVIGGAGGDVVDGESGTTADGWAAYRAGFDRELEEEVTIDTPYTNDRVGMINDDSTEVGSVHLGIVHLCRVERPEVTPSETDLIEWGFFPVDELLADAPSFETWSSLSLAAIFGKKD